MWRWHAVHIVRANAAMARVSLASEYAACSDELKITNRSDCLNRGDRWARDVRRAYNLRVKSHNFRRAPNERRFLCRKTHILPRSYNATGVGNPAEISLPERKALMTETINVQYVGFEAKALEREYSFVVRRASNETSEFTLTIGNEAFGARGVRFQDAPEICSLRLHRELAVFGNRPPEAHYRISNSDLDDYRSAHAPKATGYAYKPKDPRDS
jgi:hypothetical protein